MDGWMWAALVLATAPTLGLVWCKRRARRVYVIDHVKLEMHPARVVEDRVLEQVWRAAISMTNTSRRPRLLPVFGERATVGASRRIFLANVYLETDVDEVNPDDVALAWVEFVLPSGMAPGLIVVSRLRSGERARPLRWTSRLTQGGRQFERVG
ncbi:hypothetical protein [Microbacterium aurum]